MAYKTLKLLIVRLNQNNTLFSTTLHHQQPKDSSQNVKAQVQERNLSIKSTAMFIEIN